MSILPEFKSTCKGDKTMELSAMLMYYGNFKKKMSYTHLYKNILRMIKQ